MLRLLKENKTTARSQRLPGPIKSLTIKAIMAEPRMSEAGAGLGTMELMKLLLIKQMEQIFWSTGKPHQQIQRFILKLIFRAMRLILQLKIPQILMEEVIPSLQHSQKYTSELESMLKSSTSVSSPFYKRPFQA